MAILETLRTHSMRCLRLYGNVVRRVICEGCYFPHMWTGLASQHHFTRGMRWEGGAMSSSEEFEDTKGVIRIRTSKNDKQRSTKHTHKTKD